ncbi:hypothetical protein KQH49_06760 [Mycetohabitans sp. B5]|uniref:hypothetical protein n=1 Tax=Mycetohabitans TaxID=2571159 RepID=UPI000CE33DA9|nr:MULTISPECIES: hypothetical protein [Mycetohabitans]MCG1054670.1 hypothetical protein [Mycetohabitans sp. B5]
MKLDRAYQRKLLTILSECYPQSCRVQTILEDSNAEADAKYAANMAYLDELGLVIGGVRYGLNGDWIFEPPRITARGMDFLADDGGLSAILGVVTIKIHEESVRALLMERVEKSSSHSPEERSALAEAIRNLPARSIQTIADKLIDLGAHHLPAGIHALHTWIDQALVSIRVTTS